MGVNKVPSITGRFSFGQERNNFSFVRGQKMKRKEDSQFQWQEVMKAHM